MWRQLTCYRKSQGCHFTTMWRQLTCSSHTEGYHFTTNVYHSSATADLVSGGVAAQWVLCGQHSTGDEDAGQHHIAEVRVVTDPVAQHAEPETLEPQVTHSVVVTSLATQDTDHRLHTAFELQTIWHRAQNLKHLNHRLHTLLLSQAWQHRTQTTGYIQHLSYKPYGIEHRPWNISTMG